jgi:hypothetical protein
MVIIGVDSHKRTHTVVAVDPNGQKLASTRSRQPTRATSSSSPGADDGASARGRSRTAGM